MVSCRRTREKEYYQKQLHTDKILLIIVMVSVCASRSCGPPSTAADDWDAEQWTGCSQAVTCARCAARPSCSWSLSRQTCAGTSETAGGLRVHVRSDCPTVHAVNRFAAAGEATYAYALKIGNGPRGFAEFLARAGVRCDVAGMLLEARVTGGDTVTCAPAPVAELWLHDDSGAVNDDGDGDDGDVIVRHARVQYGAGVTLRPDNVSDGYFAVSRRPECGRAGWDAACVTCGRHDAAGTEYFVRCSSRNRCTGLYEYRDAWPPRPRLWRRPGSRADDGPLWCQPDVRVLSVEPAAAPWTGGAALRVTVRDRGILAEKAAISVTVAGRTCTEPRVAAAVADAADSVVTCVVPPAADGPDGAAAVRVRYALNRTLELAAAAASFRYAYPEVTAVERTVRYGAAANASTEWTVRGRLLDAGRRVRVWVGARDVECDNAARPSQDRIECAVPAAAEEAAAAAAVAAAYERVVVEFDRALRVYAVLGPRWTVYVGEPAVDAGQSFRALASGDTTLPVRGRRLLYAARVRFYATSGGGGGGGSGGGGGGVTSYGAWCRVTNDTHAACAAPRLDDAAATVDDVGLLMEFAGRRAVRVPAADASYAAYPDPVFTDFVADAESGTVTVRGGGGGGAGVGYSADDVTVRLYAGPDGDGGGGVGVRCEVTAVYADRLVCATTSPPAVLESARSAVVTVGGRLQSYVVAARKIAAEDGAPVAASGFVHAHRWTVLTVALVAVSMGVVAQVCLSRLKAKRREERAAAAAQAAVAAVQRKASDSTVRLPSSQCSSVDLTIV